MPRRLVPILLLLLVLAGAPPPTLAQQEVTIYRCTGKGGALTLRDSPCAPGQEQDVRNMQRPKDPAPGRDTRKPTADKPPAAPVREVQVIYRTEPRPLYECIDDRGRRYTSEDGFGNRRWVPLWTIGYPAWRHPDRRPIHHPRPPGASIPGDGVPVRRPVYAGVVAGGGTWVSDECHPLPREEVCERLSDRRYEVIRRYNTAGPTERRQLDLEQRNIDARLANECGIN